MHCSAYGTSLKQIMSQANRYRCTLLYTLIIILQRQQRLCREKTDSFGYEAAAIATNGAKAAINAALLQSSPNTCRLKNWRQFRRRKVGFRRCEPATRISDRH